MRHEPAIEVQESVVPGKTDLVESLPSQQSTRAELLRVQGVAMKGIGKNAEAAESFLEARQLSTEMVPVQQLFDELFCLSGRPALMVDRLLSFSPLDRLRVMTGDSEVGDVGHTTTVPPWRLLLPASVKSEKTDGIVSMYRELIKALDAEQAGAPIRVDLARILWRLRGNIDSYTHAAQLTIVNEDHAVIQQDTLFNLKSRPDDGNRKDGASSTGISPDLSSQSSAASSLLSVKEAKFLLNQVLDSLPPEGTYMLTDRDPLSVATSALLLMTDILMEEFRTTRKVEDKVQILLQAKELPRRRFIASQPLITDDIWSQYNTAVAHMLKKIGPMSEYEQVMTDMFDKAIAGLSDDTKFNDHVYRTSMSRIFMMEPSLHKSGEMLTVVGIDNGTYCCDGICLPFAWFDYWESDADDTYYKCLICTNCRLCQSCYETCMQWNTDPKTKLGTGFDFCCPNGQYIRNPVEG